MLAQMAGKFQNIAKNSKLFAMGWSLWPPFWGAGISVDRISQDFKEIDVSMKLSMKNANYVGTHFGGSLYAMTDPFYMIMFMQNLGREYIVWDKAAKINFKKPGKGRVYAEYRITEEDLAHVKQAMEESESGKYFWDREVQVMDEQGDVVAHVEKTLYFRKKS